MGKRHLKNLKELGCAVSGMDLRKDRIEEAGSQVEMVKQYTDFDSTLRDLHYFDGVVIASPPKFHVAQCIEIIKSGKPILLEKPVAPTLAEAKQLKEALNDSPKSQILLGYSYRWWPPLREFYNRIKKGEIKKPLHVEFVMSAYLGDWHPWERYQDFFMASKELGGGALLDESHFIDLMLWFFGKPERIFAKIERLSSLEIDTDDNVDIVAMYSDGLRVIIHLDLFGRPHQKYISITGEKATLRWSFEPNCIQFGNNIEQNWDTHSYNFERNDMFLNEVKELLQLIDGNPGITCCLQDGLDVMEIIEVCRKSSSQEKMLALE